MSVWTKADVARIRLTLDGFLLRHRVDDDVAFEAELSGLTAGMLRKWATNRDEAAAKDRRHATDARSPEPGTRTPDTDFAARLDAGAAGFEREARIYRRLADRVVIGGLPSEFMSGGWRRS